jgi:hypothetical protein
MDLSAHPPCPALGEVRNPGPTLLLGQELCTGYPFHHVGERRDEAALHGGDGIAMLAVTVSGRCGGTATEAVRQWLTAAGTPMDYCGSGAKSGDSIR